MPETTFDLKPLPRRSTLPEPPLARGLRPSPIEPRMPPMPEAKRPDAPNPANSPAVPEPRTTILGATLRFRGELRAEEDFTLQGRIEGSIHHTQNLTIGPDGTVKGDSRARSIVVEGTVEGDLYALESISIRTTARVNGNLFAPRVSIQDGANFNGRIDMATASKAAKSVIERQIVAESGDHNVDDILSGT